MTSDAAALDALYTAAVLEHYKRPRNFRALEGARHADGDNPLCGDRVTVYLRMNGDIVADATFQGYGCAIAVASASLMTESVKGKTLAEAERIFERFQRQISSVDHADAADLGALSMLAGVRQFPLRIKCATLPWRTLQAAATASHDGTVSTE